MLKSSSSAKERAAWGRWAETAATWALRLKGYRVLARGFQVKGGEIDIIAQKRGTLTFVEVKARASVSEAIEAVNATKRRRIAKAAKIYLSREQAYITAKVHNIRFDIIAVTPYGWPQHILAAFEEDVGL